MNHIRYENGISWCGAELDLTYVNFHFKTIEQATINNLHGGRLPCAQCVQCIVKVLLITPPNLQLTTPAQLSMMNDQTD